MNVFWNIWFLAENKKQVNIEEIIGVRVKSASLGQRTCEIGKDISNREK
ncbi:hypothetical protein RUMHYD_01324 [Blautia hydrogenotrophica DSM 10507]|uniref:Uncharacterized protein n=1 Tax=Blautia hydrogenotrophica (strain DSM 10507 / JCM 14656 / S5a33) TaxID=476272 RepID=C0CKF4_BLAHS|nr:hypothetical protein RUMHYD_01324 [Blautia hydrogenotrophica DSM 10507]